MEKVDTKQDTYQQKIKENKKKFPKLNQREKTYRFFFHYRKQTGGMTIHFKNTCISVKDIECKVKCETKRNKTQPYLVLQGFCKGVKLEEDKAIIF
jgi:hypothetical protein